MDTLIERICVDQNVCHGQPCIKRTRIMVYLILEYNGPRNLDRVICYTWERRGGGPSGEFEKVLIGPVFWRMLKKDIWEK